MNEKEHNTRGRISSYYMYGKPSITAAVDSIFRTNQLYDWKTGHSVILNKVVIGFCLFNNQPDALIIQTYSVIKLCMFLASSLPIIRSFVLYIRHW